MIKFFNNLSIFEQNLSFFRRITVAYYYYQVIVWIEKTNQKYSLHLLQRLECWNGIITVILRPTNGSSKEILNKFIEI